MTIGDKIIALRKENKMSQEKLAEVLGISRPTLSKIENDSASIDFEVAVKLCDYFEITLEELGNVKISNNNHEVNIGNSNKKNVNFNLNRIIKIYAITINAIILLFFAFIGAIVLYFALKNPGTIAVTINWSAIITIICIMYAVFLILIFINMTFKRRRHEN